MDSSDEEVNSRRKETIELMRIENEELIKTCSDYEAYIAAKVTNEDLFYIENPGVIKSMLKHWAHCDEIAMENKRYLVSLAEFEGIKQKQKEHSSSYTSESTLKRSSIDVEQYLHSEFFLILKDKMKLIREQFIQCIIFIRMNARHKEISGYIDLEDRLGRNKKRRDSLINGSLPMQPNASDLSFMDWSGCQVLDGGQLNPTENFQIITAGTNIKFRSKLTGFVIDPNKDDPGRRTTRVIVENPFPYLQAEFYDHCLEASDTEEEEEGQKKGGWNGAKRQSLRKSKVHIKDDSASFPKKGATVSSASSATQ
ncbi:uncharacterized protein LOC142352284 isoform X1 [Convolutriloba macropyga]|uniref:uncharacterized protein LOC142352284 isoform X1 n=1 Tax=Convolutriloba macropyga TaxID=536237 RepID=UPI003F528524